jgi:hypothetical protein
LDTQLMIRTKPVIVPMMSDTPSNARDTVFQGVGADDIGGTIAALSTPMMRHWIENSISTLQTRIIASVLSMLSIYSKTKRQCVSRRTL